jgi:proton-dependent oligopeptide transporter, POT family
MSNQVADSQDFFKSKVLGHPSGLFVLFFTEMWERFSFYGMRVLLINFLTMAVVGSNPGWEWTAGNAGALFGTYAGLLYLTPIVGGILADKLIGYRWAVVLGALVMTLGHASMAFETEFSLYVGLALLVIGTGLFKPNMTSIISIMYKDLPEKKDGAYTIFYMGVNAGAFFGMMMCGYLAEKVGWSWGFGLAGIFMLLGMLQFWFSKPLFGEIGGVPKKNADYEVEGVQEATGNVNDLLDTDTKVETKVKEKRNPFTLVDKILIVITAVIGLAYLLNDPLSKIGGINILPQEFLFSKDTLAGSYVVTIIGLLLFLYLVITRISRYDKVVRHRMIAVIIFAFFTVFFFMSFEQGATSLVLFARDYTDRILVGGAATAFNIINAILTIVPLAIISWVLILLFKQTRKQIGLSNIILAFSFLGVWGIAIWMIARDMSAKTYDINFSAVKTAVIDEKTNQQAKDEKTGELVFALNAVTESTELAPDDVVEDKKGSILVQEDMVKGSEVLVLEESGKYTVLDAELEGRIRAQLKEHNRDSQIIKATVLKEKEGVEITTSWFSILNSFFIIAFASIFSKWWDSKYNPSAAFKYGYGLILMGIGFGILAFGSSAIPQGAAAGTYTVSMIWLILAYLFHTLGELCLSPVGLSYVSKLVPARMIAFMFGMWYLAIAIGNKLAASAGGMIEEITSKYDMSTFFMIFTIIPVLAGLLVIALNPVLKKLMHGVK